eukprot:SAG22_NODE_5265_length_1050_cov_1.044164_1_plen_350_part_11
MVTAELPIVAAGHPDLVSAIDIWCPVIGALDGRGSHDKCSVMLPENGTTFAKAENYISNYSGAKTLWMYQACSSVGCGGNGCGHGQKDDPNSSSHPSSSSCIEGWPAFFPIDHKPVTSQRLMQWADFVYDVTGELYWGVLGQFGEVKQQQQPPPAQPDPTLLWKSQWTNGANGDGNLFYPGTPAIIGGKTHIPVESMRLKFVRDGVEDYEMLRQAEAALGRPRVLALIKPAIRNLGDWTKDAVTLLAVRVAVGRALAAKTDDVDSGGSTARGSSSDSRPDVTALAPQVGTNQLAALDIAPALKHFIGAVVAELKEVKNELHEVKARLQQVTKDKEASENQTRAVEAELRK